MDAGDACPCFNFDADGSLVDGAGAPAVVSGLCPSADFPTANWDFSYAFFSALDCGGTQLNDGMHDFTCYDSTDIATQVFPNQSANDDIRFDCGCTLAAGTCDCGVGGVTEADLETGCSFDPATCNIVCSP